MIAPALDNQNRPDNLLEGGHSPTTFFGVKDRQSVHWFALLSYHQGFQEND